jgi:hypothetical protein
MCKKALSILLVLALAIVAPAFQSFASEEDLYDLKAKILELEESLYKVGEMVKDLTFNVQENQALAEIVKEMSFQFKKSEGELHSISSLQDRIERDVIPQMISIQSTVASLGASMNEKVKALGIRVYEAESSVQQISARVKSNEDRLRYLDGIEHEVRSINERLYGVEKSLEMGAPGPVMEQQSEGINEETANALTDLDSRVNSLSFTMKSLKDAFALIESHVVLLETHAFDDEAEFAALSEAMSALQFSIDSARSRIGGIEAMLPTYAAQEDVTEMQSQIDVLSVELQKVRNSANTNFVVGVLGVLAGIGALALVFF